MHWTRATFTAEGVAECLNSGYVHVVEDVVECQSLQSRVVNNEDSAGYEPGLLVHMSLVGDLICVVIDGVDFENSFRHDDWGCSHVRIVYQVHVAVHVRKAHGHMAYPTDKEVISACISVNMICVKVNKSTSADGEVLVVR